MVELLSPVGDFECLKAAVQNGADCVYFGADSFSARAFASNFDLTNLEKAITYAKLRGVKTNLTLNTLIKNNELNSAYELAKNAYEFGIDAIIVQDLGLGLKLIHDFPDLDIHASTQMSVHNLQGVLKLQELGFKRVVLARELSAEEIQYICEHSNIEIECFVHGALCISYSGQCLLSSMIGGRSGNRGKCAQPCRLPYTLVDQNKNELDNGYLLSPADLCGLEYLPFLINAGVDSLKIEGRMKTPEYVATVTRIYRKYIDLANSNKKFIIDEKDKKELLQVFNRGLSSTGHLSKDANQNLIYKYKSNNMGLPLGIVQNYNPNKGYITLKLKEPIQIGDTISLEKEDGTYTVSELMGNLTSTRKNSSNKKQFENLNTGKIGQIVTIGRMKGNINIKDKIYKMSSKELNIEALDSIKNESRKIPLTAKITINRKKPISINITSSVKNDLYQNLNIKYYLNAIPAEAKSTPISEDFVKEKISKTGNTPYEFTKLSINLEDNLFVPTSCLNELRRKSLEEVETYIINKIKRKSTRRSSTRFLTSNKLDKKNINTRSISVLLNVLNLNYDYSKLKNIDKIYIPLKYFSDRKYKEILENLSSNFNIYIYMPTIIKANYRNIFFNNIENAIKTYNIKGFVISHISNCVLLEAFINKLSNEFEIIANYTFNIYNNSSIEELYNLGITTYTVSPELDKNTILSLYSKDCKQELICYGRIPLMNINYCLLGKTNKCYPKCEAKCTNLDNKYFIKDRLNMLFPIIPDNIQTVTTIYNSKILSILPSEFNMNSLRIDILHENINEINLIVETIKNNYRFEGKDYTNGNLNREI